MRFIFLVLALAVGSNALADGSGQDWTEIPVEQEFDEFYLEDERQQLGDDQVTIINNEYNYINIEINNYPEAPAFIPMPPQPPPVQFCFGQNVHNFHGWIVGWRIFARLWDGRAILLSYGSGGYNQAFYNLYASGQCPNSF